MQRLHVWVTPEQMEAFVTSKKNLEIVTIN